MVSSRCAKFPNRGGVRVDFNQGLDARLITPEIAGILGKLKWIEFVRVACDTDEMLPVVLDRAKLLEENGIKPWRVFVYLLVKDIPSAERRAVALRDAGLQPFAQPYRDFEKNLPPTKEARSFARWVNQKAAFNSAATFADYKSGIRGHNKERETEQDAPLLDYLEGISHED